MSDDSGRRRSLHRAFRVLAALVLPSPLALWLAARGAAHVTTPLWAFGPAPGIAAMALPLALAGLALVILLVLAVAALVRPRPVRRRGSRRAEPVLVQPVPATLTAPIVIDHAPTEEAP